MSDRPATYRPTQPSLSRRYLADHYLGHFLGVIDGTRFDPPSMTIARLVDVRAAYEADKAQGDALTVCSRCKTNQTVEG